MQSNGFSDDQLLTRPQAAKFLNIKEQTLAVWASSKRYPLPMVKVGRSVRYRLSDLEAFVAQNTTGRDRI